MPAEPEHVEVEDIAHLRLGSPHQGRELLLGLRKA